MTLNVPEFNVNNTDEKIQIDTRTNAVQVYVNGSWQAHNFGELRGLALDKACFGTTTPLVTANMALADATADGAALTTDVPVATAILLVKGMTVTSLALVSGATALAA